MKKTMTWIFITSAIALALVGCSPSGDGCSEVISDLEALQIEYAALEANHADLLEQHNTQSELYETCQRDLSASASECDTLQGEIEQLESALGIGPTHTISRTEFHEDPAYWSQAYQGKENQFFIQLDNALKRWESASGYFAPEYMPDILTKAVWLYYTLSDCDINAVFVLGNLDDSGATFEECYDVWLIMQYNPTDEELDLRWWSLDAELVSPVIRYSDYDGNPIEENAKYYETGFLYKSLDDLRADIAYRWQRE